MKQHCLSLEWLDLRSYALILSMQIRSAILHTTLLSVLLSGVTLANDTQQRLFKQFDGNGDGKLTESEFTHAVMLSLFKEYDLNHDGKVSREEFLQHAKDKEMAAREYPLIDRAQKGHISFKDVKKYQALKEELRATFKRVLPAGHSSVSLEQLQQLQLTH